MKICLADHAVTGTRLAGGFAAALLFSAVAAAPALSLEIKTSDVHGEGYPTTEAIKYMGDLLSQWTNGRITVNLFPSMQLGGEKEALEQVQLGALEMTRVSVGVVGPIVDDFNVFNLPYVFRSLDQQHTVVDGEIGTRPARQARPAGLIGLGYMDAGSRSFYVKGKPIEKPERPRRHEDPRHAESDVRRHGQRHGRQRRADRLQRALHLAADRRRRRRREQPAVL